MAPRPKGETIQQTIKRQSKEVNDHIIWIGCLDGSGYGKIRYNGKRLGVHRVVWELHNGPIPTGKMVLHTCDIRDCIKPEHLFLGTSQDNVKDMIEKGRFRPGQPTLTHDEIRTIRKSTNSTYSLAKEYSIAESTVRAIRGKRTYKEVPD